MVAILIIIVSLVIMIVVGNNNKNENWILESNKVSKGKQIYEIGDYYEYDESNVGKITNLIDVKWKILGVSDDGNLLLVSSSNVEEVTLGSKDDLEKAKNDYIDGDKKLDEIASKYAHGKNALSGRSINIEDINKITKVDSVSRKTYSYYWGSKANPITIDEETNENMTKIITSENTLFVYNYEIYDEETYEYVPFMEKDTKEYNMLFKDDTKESNSYWVSTKYANATNRYISYGYNVVKNADVNYTYLVYSSQNITEITFDIRPVIEIK